MFAAAARRSFVLACNICSTNSFKAFGSRLCIEFQLSESNTVLPLPALLLSNCPSCRGRLGAVSSRPCVACASARPPVAAPLEPARRIRLGGCPCRQRRQQGLAPPEPARWILRPLGHDRPRPLPPPRGPSVNICFQLCHRDGIIGKKSLYSSSIFPWHVKLNLRRMRIRHSVGLCLALSGSS